MDTTEAVITAIKEVLSRDKIGHNHTIIDEKSYKLVTKVNDEKPEQVNHPAHYNNYPIEAIDMMVGIFGLEKTIDFCYMTALKYRFRLGHKDDINQDLAKEQWYLNKAKELTEHLNNSLDGSK